jgi:hypothetical protein
VAADIAAAGVAGDADGADVGPDPMEHHLSNFEALISGLAVARHPGGMMSQEMPPPGPTHSLSNNPSRNSSGGCRRSWPIMACNAPAADLCWA